MRVDLSLLNIFRLAAVCTPTSSMPEFLRDVGGVVSCSLCSSAAMAESLSDMASCSCEGVCEGVGVKTIANLHNYIR